MRSLLLLGSSSAAAAAGCSLSNVFGDHVVLQRAPTPSSVWGFAAAGTTVKTSFGANSFSSTADASGVWRQPLSLATTTTPFTMNFSCSSGEAFALRDVLVGDVHICGGQSNMQFTVGCSGDQAIAKGEPGYPGYDAPAEIAAANNYPLIRTMTVGETTTSYTPLSQLAVPPTLPWSVASSASIGFGNWSATSAVCWYYGRNLYDATGVPQGLVSSNWGGTIIQSWSDNATNAECGATAGAVMEPPPEGLDGPEAFGTTAGPNPNTGFGVLFNAMIHPFTLGPLGIRTVIWFQGESNSGAAAYYQCAQPAMVNSWRDYFNTSAFFGFVELEPWLGPGSSLATFRTAQLATLSAITDVGYATGTDIGDPLGAGFGSVHPRNKKLIGRRLANAALDVSYGMPAQWLPPVYKSASASAAGAALTVTVFFDNVPSTLVPTDDRCHTEIPYNVSFAACAWFSVVASDGSVLNATAAVGADGTSVVLTATAATPGLTAVATAFGFNAWPINMIKSAEGFPIRPWNFTRI